MKIELIAALEKKGFKRWTKGSMDRLYINPTSIGLELDFYKTGNVSYATLNGERISNSRGTAMKEAKCYIDIATGKCVSSYDVFVEAMEQIVAEAEADLAAETAETAENAETIENTETTEERGMCMKKLYWDYESWGNGYPPVNHEEICSRANEMIDEYAAAHPDYDEMDVFDLFAEKLWEDFCKTGEVGGAVAIYEDDDEH